MGDKIAQTFFGVIILVLVIKFGASLNSIAGTLTTVGTNQISALQGN